MSLICISLPAIVCFVQKLTQSTMMGNLGNMASFEWLCLQRTSKGNTRWWRHIFRSRGNNLLRLVTKLFVILLITVMIPAASNDRLDRVWLWFISPMLSGLTILGLLKVTQYCFRRITTMFSASLCNVIFAYPRDERAILWFFGKWEHFRIIFFYFLNVPFFFCSSLIAFL